MSYELLKSLYGGHASNADLVRKEDLTLLHIDTPVEGYVLQCLRAKKDVVLTGNPGDGKSHVIRLLQARGNMPPAVLEPDLSAQPTADVTRRWAAAAASGSPFILCGNEGPLLELIDAALAIPALVSRATELRDQLGHLVGPRRESLARTPERVVLIDLADRNLIDERNIEQALSRVAQHKFLPHELKTRATQSSAGRNIMMLSSSTQSTQARKRLAALIAIGGRRRGGHFTFRQLWQAVALAITGGKAASTLNVELSQGKIGLGTYPADNIVKANAHGALIEAVRAFADPASVTDPDLDEALWSQGVGGLGRVDADAPHEVPAALWEQGLRDAAIQTHLQLKRYVAIAHPEGDALLSRLRERSDLPSRYDDAALLTTVINGIRRLYVPPGDDELVPDWLLSGIPLWIGHTYADIEPTRRPYVAAGARPADEFGILRPERVPWLSDVIGPPPDEAWLLHKPSGALLRLDPELLDVLVRAPTSAGPLPLPERVQRFLARLAGWEEAHPEQLAGRTSFAVLSHPRGQLIVHGGFKQAKEGASYA
ncbi:hypothetical protein [Corallococcus llansteffanensis]|uniref:Uncharacterized protein n=1 Tax=Corallococcus llansteffanensis TaxID=2316731 RepID=A0A3A8Q7V2_9BACT|nr:hypothetical protein [Corallococcus llansteffanensis]RKH62295.1 hypothetical protein D7V93_10315 [Corallococcus llansteffanensis]